MDSLTQAALGAVVGGLVLGGTCGWRGFVWGAALGTLPDLDSLIDYGGAVAAFTSHRGYSHAIAIHTLVAPLIGWALSRLHRCAQATAYRWIAATWLVLVTHALLDAATVYGTRIALPFRAEPVGLGSIFIIDPLFTIPLIVGLAGAARAGWRSRRARVWSVVGLSLATAYLVATVLLQNAATAQAHAAIAERGLNVERVLVTPTPFNAVVWRVLAVGSRHYWEGFHTIGAEGPIVLRRHRRNRSLLEGIGEHAPVTRLRAFTDGFFTVLERDGEIVVADLRMGQGGYYAFAFAVAERSPRGPRPHPARRYRLERPPLGRVLTQLIDCAWGGPGRDGACRPSSMGHRGQGG